MLKFIGRPSYRSRGDYEFILFKEEMVENKLNPEYVSYGKPIVMEPVPPPEEYPYPTLSKEGDGPTFSLTQAECQGLVDLLWGLGFRASAHDAQLRQIRASLFELLPRG